MNEKPKCGNCFHFYKQDRGPDLCKRFPPVLIHADVIVSSFPWVEEDNICGEYKGQHNPDKGE